MIQIELRLFGAFRRYDNLQGALRLEMPGPATIAAVKEAAARRFRELVPAFGLNEERLIQDSAIADERDVLPPEHVVTGACKLLILPPVCGG